MCMGSTNIRMHGLQQFKNHPHVYGEYSLGDYGHTLFIRITPMCMGST